MTPTALMAGELADRGIAFKNLDAYEETKGWTDQSVTWVIPTAGNLCHWDVVDSWEMVDWPMNQTRTGRLRTRNMEVADAYNYLFKVCIDRESCLKAYNDESTSVIVGTRFVWTTEQDNIIPPNAITGLMAAIYTCPDCGKEIEDMDEWNCPEGHHGYDAVSGLYFTKETPPRPMAYGNPKNGPNDFAPQPVKEAVLAKKTIEVNGIGMGCAIWHKGLFPKVSEPWFKTVPGSNKDNKGGQTQDLHFCQKAKREAGARFGVNCAVRVGHTNFKDGKTY